MSDNEYTIDLSNMNGTTDTITVTGTNDMDSSWVSVGDITTSTIDIDSIITSTITLDDTHWADGITWEQTEFEDKMPSVAKVEDMCKDYPALAKAYENFKTIYAMVHQDWKGNQDNEETPF
jgi:hypothetical protein